MSLTDTKLLQKDFQLSIAVPAYNEEAGLEPLVLSWYYFLKAQSEIIQFEIVICNDGSTDQTAFILERLSKRYTEIVPLHFANNQGAAAALTAAIARTRLEWVLLMDADGQFLIEDLLKMRDHLHANNGKAVSGKRQKKDHFISVLGSKISGNICNWVHGSHLKDFNSAFKLIHGPLLRSLWLEAKGMNYSLEITSRLLEKGIVVSEVDINHQPRQKGKSKIKFRTDSVHRFLFVLYLSFRQFLFKLGVLRRSE